MSIVWLAWECRYVLCLFPSIPVSLTQTQINTMIFDTAHLGRVLCQMQQRLERAVA